MKAGRPSRGSAVVLTIVRNRAVSEQRAGHNPHGREILTGSVHPGLWRVRTRSALPLKPDRGHRPEMGEDTKDTRSLI